MSIKARLSTKMNRRIFATIIGIAFCVTYLAGTIAIVGGLHETTATLAAGFDQGPVLVFSDEDFERSMVDGGSLPGNDTKFVGFCFTNVTVRNFHGGMAENIYAVSIYDPYDTLGLNMTNESVNSPVLVGTQLVDILEENSISAEENVVYLLGKEDVTTQVRVDSIYSTGSIFPDDWILIPRQKMNVLKPELEGNYSFLMIIDSEEPVEELACCTGNVSLRPTSGVVGFFERGIYQVEEDLWSIILISGLMTALLVYCIIAIETEYYAPTIKILRGMGANRGFVIQIFMFKALFITFVGGVLGTALGFCAASGISSLSSFMGVVSFVTPVANFKSVVLPVLIALVSGLVGGFWPAIKASRIFIARRRGI